MAIRFNNTNELLKRTTGAFLDPSNDFTYMFWVRYITNTPSAGEYRSSHVLFTGGTTDYTDPFIWEGSNIATLDINFFGTDDPASGPGYSDYVVASPVSLTTWYHVAFVYDASAKQVTCYINAVSQT